MNTKLLLLAFSPVAVFSAAVAVGKGFTPDNVNLTWDGAVDLFPLTFNLSDSQHRSWTQIDGSFWVNSFLHGSNGHDYYIASHVMNYASDIQGAKPVYRASILDITDPTFYMNWDRIAPSNTTFWTSCGDFRARFDNFGMETLSKDPLQGIHTYSSMGGFDFDLIFNFTSPVLLNGALGAYQVGGALGFEWSVPRGATQGWFTVNGERIDVVPEKSFSWYDRQWGSLQDSFDWLMLHFEESDWFDISLMAAWRWEDVVNGPKEFATVRSSRNGRDSVVPATITASETNVWVSPATGLVYPQEWLMIIDDVEFIVTSPRPDQVVEADADTGFPSQFSGYVDVVVKKAGHPSVRGWGAVDRMTIE